MNIVLRELRANLKFILLWSAFMIFFVYMGMAKYQGFSADPEMIQVLNNLPAELLKAFNMDVLNLTKVQGYVGVFQSYLLLITSIFAVILGSDIISKEERDKTVEFSLTKPITRAHLVTAKVIVAVLLCVALIGVIWLAFLVFTRPFEPGSEFYPFLALMMSSIFLVELVYLSAGLLLGCALKRFKLASNFAVGVVLITYFISVLTELFEEIAFLAVFAPIAYFDGADMLRNMALDPGKIVLCLGIAVVFTTAGYLVYNRRDLYI